ncbi:MAG: GNAT family N-acetyltransferase [candidate division Zixibacteria bacterium]|nr:GNAT family N-acetyltransferase [candidate division Zixibacteria bacterium]
MYFKPNGLSIKQWFKDAFNYYLRYRLRSFLIFDSYSIVFKVRMDEMDTLDRWNVDKNLSLDKVDPENPDELMRLVYPWRRRQFKKLFANGSICLVGRLNGKIISYGWNSIGRIDPLVQKDFGYYDIPLGINDSWGIDIVVHHAHRGKGYEFAAFKHGQKYWMERGIEHFWGAVYTGDRGSLKMHHRIGYKPVYINYHKRRFGFKKTQLWEINEDSIEIVNKATRGKNISFLWKDFRDNKGAQPPPRSNSS